MRACLKFPIKKYNQVIFAFSFGLFFRFYSIASYPLHKNYKTFSKEALKPDPREKFSGMAVLNLKIDIKYLYLSFAYSVTVLYKNI